MVSSTTSRANTSTGCLAGPLGGGFVAYYHYNNNYYYYYYYCYCYCCYYYYYCYTITTSTTPVSSLVCGSRQVSPHPGFRVGKMTAVNCKYPQSGWGGSTCFTHKVKQKCNPTKVSPTLKCLFGSAPARKAMLVPRSQPEPNNGPNTGSFNA